MTQIKLKSLAQVESTLYMTVKTKLLIKVLDSVFIMAIT